MTRARFNLAATVLAALVFGGWSCAQKPYIDVGLLLPPAYHSLAQHTVFIETHDLRGDAPIFNPRAQEQFSNFTGLFALILEGPDNQHTVLGAYQLPLLFETAMAQRLLNLGATIADNPAADALVLHLTIDRFTIHLVDRKWMTDIGYEAALSQNGRQLARERIIGSAQRAQIMGRIGAEKVIGEIFTEMINRLDMEALFKQARR